MSHDDDAAEDLLAGVDLHAWRVPPPPAEDRRAILVRALTPAATPRRRRLAWLVAAIVTFNVAVAAIVVIIVSRAPAPTIVTLRPAGDGSVDGQVQELLRRVEQEQRELERRLAEIRELRVLVEQLSAKVRQYEQRDKHDRPVPNRPVPPATEPVESGACDEVSCVLLNYEPACCAKFKSGHPAPRPAASDLPEALDRSMISAAIAKVKPQVIACRDRSPATGIVKVRIRVGPAGRPTSVIVDATPDSALGACVAAAVQTATFEVTRDGGTFTYPFVF